MMMSPGMRAYIDTKTPLAFRPSVYAWFSVLEKQCDDSEVAQVVAWLLDSIAKLREQAVNDAVPGAVDEAIAILPVAAALLHKASERLVEEAFGDAT